MDKIGDMQSLKKMLLDIKAVFDIEGVNYFLSLSEDAYQSFVQSGSFGKNEFDSSFDHFVWIPEMDITNTSKIAFEYMNQYSASNESNDENDETISELALACAAASFGVPRDVIRNAEIVIIDNIKTSSDFFSTHRAYILESAKLSRTLDISAATNMDKIAKGHGKMSDREMEIVETIMKSDAGLNSEQVIRLTTSLVVSRKLEYFLNECLSNKGVVEDNTGLIDTYLFGHSTVLRSEAHLVQWLNDQLESR